MKKTGFTLAEVLITLGLIGVIAALTLPSLMTDTTAAQIGPKLAKAVSMFEQGNEALLNINSTDTLTDAGLVDDVASYGDSLSNYLKITPFTYPSDVTQSAANTGSDCEVGNGFDKGTPFLSKDGMLYVINLDKTPDTSMPPHKQRIGNVYVDINGAAKPNSMGTDIFAFSLWNDGSLKPVGSANWSEDEEACSWQDSCANNEFPSDYQACTGSIFENNLKVLYK